MSKGNAAGMGKICSSKPTRFDSRVAKVNSGKYRLEFLYRYNQGNNNAIWKCSLHRGKKPYFADCEIKITYASVQYAWNRLREDRTW